MSAWQTMETAPRDGTRIMLSRNPDRPRRRNVVIGRYNDYPGSKKWVAEPGTYHRESDFNGWMPLPFPSLVVPS